MGFIHRTQGQACGQAARGPSADGISGFD